MKVVHEGSKDIRIGNLGGKLRVDARAGDVTGLDGPHGQQPRPRQTHRPEMSFRVSRKFDFVGDVVVEAPNSPALRRGKDCLPEDSIERPL